MAVRPENKRGSAPAPVLSVQVYQGPAMQSEGEFALNSSRVVRVGKSAQAELSVPFAPFPTDLRLFEVSKWGAKVLLDPRLDGFVSDGQRFGSVRDFVAPRGALKELATVLEPLEVAIPEGSRGALEISGYTIVFRVAKAKPTPAAHKIKGAPKAPFAMPHGQTAFENAGFLLGLVSTVCITIPAIIWLNKSPIHSFSGISELSPFLSAEIIHPDHFQLLPWAFASDFDGQKISMQAVRWVEELRTKWQAEELGGSYDSPIPVLRGFSVPEDIVARRRGWQSTLDDSWKVVVSRRDAAAPGTFMTGQKAYTPFRVAVSGGERGSIAERVRARLERLNKTHTAAVSMIHAEHEYMKGHFGEQSAEIQEIFDPPKEPGLFFRLAEKAFSEEKLNYQLAESFAALARKKQKNSAAADSVARIETEQPLVWSGDSLTVASVLTIPRVTSTDGNEEQLFKNAKLALGKLPPPSVPKPPAKISIGEVESFVRSRSPEVKRCYDLALNRNPQLAGSILWKWTIAENGRLSRSKVENTTIKDPVFIGCLEKKIKAWTFPKPVNGAITISFPFRFVVRENLDTLERISR